MRRVLAVFSAAVGLVVAASCGSSPPPTSTTPATPGSAVILPSPVTAEMVPKGDPAPSASASASHS